MSDESSRKRQYERALRWYPMDWRREHGPALVGDLMDQDDARGRQRLAVGDRFSLAIHGLKMWSLQRATPSSATVVLRSIGLAGGALVAIWYWTVSPSDVADVFGALPAGTSVLSSREPKTFLNNGTVVPAVLLALALAASLARRDTLARIFAATAALAALVVTQLATGTWGGPDGPIGALLIMLGIAGAVHLQRWSAVFGFVALMAGVLLLELWLAGASPILAAAAGACGLATAVIGVLALRHWLRRRGRGTGARAC